MTSSIQDLPGLVERLRGCMLQNVPKNQTAGHCSSLPYMAADALKSLAAENARLNEECERAWEAQRIAFEQAMSNGQRASDLRRAAELGLEWVIDAANERREKDGVFDNAMRDIKRIEDALSGGSPG